MNDVPRGARAPGLTVNALRARLLISFLWVAAPAAVSAGPATVPHLEVVRGTVRFEIQAFVSGTRFHKIEGVGNRVSGGVLSSGSFQVKADLRALSTRNRQRDRDLHEKVLHTARFPEAAFSGSVTSFDATGGATELSGTLELHGQKRPLRVSGKLSVENGRRLFRAEFVISLRAFEIVAPRNLFVLRVGDELRVRVELELREGGAGS